METDSESEVDGVETDSESEVDAVESDSESKVDTMETDSEPEEEGNVEGNHPSTLDDGLAATDLERPIDMEKAKINDHHQRRIRQYSESQALIRESFTDGLMRIKSQAISICEKGDEDDRIRDLKNEERYMEMYDDTRRRQAELHGMDMVSKDTELIRMMIEIGRKLSDAMRKLEEIDPDSLATKLERITMASTKR